MNGVLKSLEETLADVQRVDAKVQSALDMKKQNLKDETKKRQELVKSMEEVSDGTFVSPMMTKVAVNINAPKKSFTSRTRKCSW